MNDLPGEVKAIIDSASISQAGKVAIYTAVFGAYDSPSEIPSTCENADYYCFTDGKVTPPRGWNIRTVSRLYRDPRRTAKIFKVFANEIFPQYECNVWVDGNVEFKDRFTELLQEAKSNLLTCFPHPQRKSIYAEAVACVLQGKERISAVLGQMARYFIRGLPAKSGLIAGTVLIRKGRNSFTASLMKAWWSEIEKGSVRDQLSLNFVAWELGAEIEYLPYDLTENPFFSWKSHPSDLVYRKNGRPVSSAMSLVFSTLRKIRNALRNRQKKSATC